MLARTNLCRSAALGAWVLIGCSVTLAQVNTATILGSVMDPSGAGAPGAVVTATQVATQATHTAVADESGAFPFSGPGPITLDFSVFKNISITERARLQFRTEFFNLPNRANFNNPGTALTSGTFGQITSAGNAREIQFALKLLF